jgi:hypothetical protein
MHVPVPSLDRRDRRTSRSRSRRLAPASSSLRAFLVVGLLAMLGCSSEVPATVTVRPQLPLPANAKVLVLAAYQRDRIIQSVERAGLSVTDEWGGADYILEVKLGSTRRTMTCGTVRNVIYVVSRRRASRMVVKARGPTGSCDPNVFDEMSRKLAAFSARPS